MVASKTKQVLGRVLLRPMQKFFHGQAAGGVVLLVAAVLALAWSNSPWGHTYDSFWHHHVSVSVAGLTISESLAHWINDGLMVIFFLVVGLEIKREIIAGELSTWNKAALPMVAALGGMVTPAAIYVAMHLGQPDLLDGWGVPMATDIAFAIGVMSLMGDRVPLSLKVFLTALAIVDDLGAILVIALFYSDNLSMYHLAMAAGVMVVLLLCNRLGMRSVPVYTMLGVCLWYAILNSGVHATIAGVLLAIAIPGRPKMSADEYSRFLSEETDRFDRIGTSAQKGILSAEHLDSVVRIERLSEYTTPPLQRIEHALHPWVNFVIMPLFALANIGVSLEGMALGGSVSLGVALGLFVGKQLGITGFSWVAWRLGWVQLPSRVSWQLIYGTACLAGIGATMSLFISNLAFSGELLAQSKVGILVGSLLSGVFGWTILWLSARSSPAPAAAETGANHDAQA